MLYTDAMLYYPDSGESTPNYDAILAEIRSNEPLMDDIRTQHHALFAPAILLQAFGSNINQTTGSTALAQKLLNDRGTLIETLATEINPNKTSDTPQQEREHKRHCLALADIFDHLETEFLQNASDNPAYLLDYIPRDTQITIADYAHCEADPHLIGALGIESQQATHIAQAIESIRGSLRSLS